MGIGYSSVSYTTYSYCINMLSSLRDKHQQDAVPGRDGRMGCLDQAQQDHGG